MSVSGVNPSRPPTAITPVRAPLRDRSHNTRQDTASLTDRDRELIFQATGQRVGVGTNQGWINSLATAIAADRASGQLGPGQEITAFYLKDLSHRYDQSAGRNPVSGYLDSALRYLSQHGGGSRLDIKA